MAENGFFFIFRGNRGFEVSILVKLSEVWNRKCAYERSGIFYYHVGF